MAEMVGKGKIFIFKFKYVEEGKSPFCVVGRDYKHCFLWRHMNLVHFWSAIQSSVF